MARTGMVQTRQPPSLAEKERAALKAQAEARERMRRLIEALLAGSLLLTAWRLRMRAEIRRLHFAIVIIAGGDLEGDPELRRRVLLEVEQQMRYLERWVMQLQAQMLTDNILDSMVARAALYATATRQTFFLAFTRSFGLPFLPFYPKERTVCSIGCKCWWRIRRLDGRGNFDCFWQVGIAEHCPTCITRSVAASPLQVRGGVILKPERYQAIELYA